MDLFRQVTIRPPEQLAFRAVELAVELAPGGPVGPRPRAPAIRSYRRHLGGPSLDGRLPGTAGPAEARWAVRWSTPLGRSFSLLQHGDRILAQAPGVWTLLDGAQGREIATGAAGRAALYIDSDGDPQLGPQFLSLDATSAIESRNLTDGALRFKLPLARAPERYSWAQLLRRNNQIVAAGTETELYAHVRRPATESVVVAYSMTSPLAVDFLGQARSIDRHESLIFGDPRGLPVLAGSRLVLVLPDHVAVLDDRVTGVPAVYHGSFKAAHVSADETGLVHMLVVEPPGRSALWVVSLDGRRLLSAPLAPEHADTIGPPIIGYDHRVFLVTRSRAAALGADGALLWERMLPAAPAGAGVTADDQLIVAAGNEVLAFLPTGEGRMVYALDAAITAPPVLTATGDLLVATEGTLVCLARG